MKLRAQTAVYAEELLVHDRSKGESAERIHARLVYSLRVFMLAFELEGEVVGQMPALVVSAKQPERIGIPDLQRPQVQDTLQRSARERN